MTVRPTPDRPVRCAFVLWGAMPAVPAFSGGAVGGMETRAWLLARTMAAKASVAPVFVVEHTFQPPRQKHRSVELVVHVNRWKSIRNDVSRFLYSKNENRWRSFKPSLLWQIPLLIFSYPFRHRDAPTMSPDPRLDNVKADVWFAFGVSGDAARTIATAKSRQQPSILFLASNDDLDERYVGPSTFVNQYGDSAEECRFAIENASMVICQTEVQRQRLRERFQRQGELIRNPIDLSEWTRSKQDGRKYVLWIGRYDDIAKRVTAAVEIAKRCADIPFMMIINPQNRQLQYELEREIPSNVELVSYVPYTNMDGYYANATILLSTSNHDKEGFPNVLLQAAATDTPIVSLDDFDSFLLRSGAGVHTHGRIDTAVDLIRKLYAGQQTIDHQQTHEYLRQYHDVEAIVGQLLKLLDGQS